VAVPVQRSPDPSLLLPCVDPLILANPDDPGPAFDNAFAGDAIRTRQAYEECKQRQADLVKFEVGGGAAP
jgi:hypothetical protein